MLRDLVARVAAASAPETNTIYAVVLALGAIGLALAVLAVWLIRQTQPERELLAPLERMHDRSWRKQEPAQMRRDLDEAYETAGCALSPRCPYAEESCDSTQKLRDLTNGHQVACWKAEQLTMVEA